MRARCSLGTSQGIAERRVRTYCLLTFTALLLSNVADKKNN
jgi:hypothetical protein